MSSDASPRGAPDAGDANAQLVALLRRLADRERQIVVLRNENMALRQSADADRALAQTRLDETAARLADITARCDALSASTSWRLTRPLRAVIGILRRDHAYVSELLRLFSRFPGVRHLTERLAPPPALPSAAVAQVTSESRVPFRSNDYEDWMARYDRLDGAAREGMRASIAVFSRQPLISILMPVFDPPVEFLDAAIWSVRSQLYPFWELCIADDCSTNPGVRDLLARHAADETRVRLALRESNGHISAASNSALQLAAGDYVALLDHDDLLAEHALFWVAQTILDHPDAGLIYSDEDKITEDGRRYDPYFKCELNRELLLAQNMISHLGVYRRDVIDSVGGFRVGLEGSQDYDLALRTIERLDPGQVRHIPRVLYHWRAIAGSTARSGAEKSYAVEAGRRAVAEHLIRQGVVAEVGPAPDAPAYNRVRFPVPEPTPLVTVIIPTRDRSDLLATCLDSIFRRTNYARWEVVIVDNGSVERDTADFLASLPPERVRIVRDDSPFNFSRLNNRGAESARGDLLCLMNNDIEVLSADWLEELVSFATRPGIGCVGARLWYPDGRIQHAGVFLGYFGIAGHFHKFLPKGATGYFGRAVLHQEVSAVTGALLMVRREIYDRVGGLDEDFAVAFNDIDFCLRVREAGYRNLWTPYAEMIHHESVSRGTEDTPEKMARFQGEIRRFSERWGEALLQDPAYSPNLTLDAEDLSLAWPPRVAPITEG